MFLEAFGLTRDPFMDTADPAFYYETIACANGRRRLAECLLTGRGLAVIVGPIGAGKTTLCNAVQEDVLGRPGVRAGLILDPSFADENEFLSQIASSLGIAAGASAGVRTTKEEIKRALFGSIADGVQYILFIDEAQSLPEALFESLRGLLNYQIDQRKLLSVALSGQMELAPALTRHPSLSDRIAVWIELGPLLQSEAAALLDHRLRRAGFSGSRSPLGPEAADLAWRLSGGLPRRLTVIAREAMEVAAERGGRTVDVADVEAARLRVPPAAPAEPAQRDVRSGKDAPVKARWPWNWFAP
jgi:type II secretory pathway predicted ATPase ExeA